MELACIASLNVASTLTVLAAEVEPGEGDRETTTGVLTSDVVVNVHATSAAIALPPRSFTPPAPLRTRAEYEADGARRDVGVSVALRAMPSYATVPGTTVPEESRSTTVVVVIVCGSMSLLNTAETSVPVGTFVAALAGFVEVTVGGVVSTGTTGWFMSC